MLKQTFLKNALALWRSPNIGPVRFFNYLKQMPNLEYLPENIQPDWKAVDLDLSWINSEKNQHIITYNCPQYPRALKEISNPPPLLFVKGCLNVLNDPQIAMVGSRNASVMGLDTAQKFATELAALGITITSGLALGIDTYSHKGALAANGTTIAVLANGLNEIYPRQNQQLFYKISEQGAVISEMPIGVKPHPKLFPRRNRIISGLSLAVLVVEAATKSGSLITANTALEQSREVFAIPGSIANTKSTGCHDLIRSGATLIYSAKQLLEDLFLEQQLNFDGNKNKNSLEKCSNLSKKESFILTNVDYAATPLDLITIRTGLQVEQITGTLLDLELRGYLQAVSGGYARMLT